MSDPVILFLSVLSCILIFLTCYLFYKEYEIAGGLCLFLSLSVIGALVVEYRRMSSATNKVVNVEEFTVFRDELYYRDTLVYIEGDVKAAKFIIRCKEEIVLTNSNSKYYFSFKNNE